MLQQHEHTRHPASFPSRHNRPRRDCYEGSRSRRGLHAARRHPRRGSDCRKSLLTPGSDRVKKPDHGGPLFDGQYTNTDTGLIYMRARVYDPSTAQFLTVDPAVGTTRAPYNYAGDNPLNEADPSGRSVLGEIGNFLEPLNPIKYYEEEIESYENGCGYFASVAHGLEGVVVGALDASGAGEEGLAAEGVEEGGTAIEDTLAGLQPGNSPDVYEVDSPEELQRIYDGLSSGGKPVSSSYPGEEVELPDGTRVGIRETSKSGGPTVDINQGGTQYKIHVTE
jgi:RHS repeat-associated protein